MEKIKVKKQIFFEQKNEHFTWKDIKDIQFEDDDEILIQYVEPYYSENNSWDGHFSAEVIRMVEETDEQYQKRMKKSEEGKVHMRKMRYESYLKLKQEFEDEKSN
jgi:hypothetical protein